ncbi:MAG TPA: acyl-CoA dehydrogenase family protein [Kofleriaceae bacterium]|nr:acyl-CoA dehydrogenase family protein [Kofleriaceae bacterium]
MQLELTPAQDAIRRESDELSRGVLAPEAGAIDRGGAVPRRLIDELARVGYLGALAPRDVGGRGLSFVELGVVHEAVGRACSSLRSLLTVHSMVLHTVLTWGSDEQRARWATPLARGERLGAFGLSEPGAGSDASSVATTATAHGDDLVLDGTKRWITFGQIADVYLVFAKLDGMSVALLVERTAPGLTVTPIDGMLGTRGSMLAELRFTECRVPQRAIVGGIGFGIAAIASSALDVGRFSVASGCVGIGQASLDASLAYAAERHQFGRPIAEHQLVRRLLTNMITEVKAARLLCMQAGCSKDARDPRTIMDTCVAKYFASQMAVRVANDAVQVHGANGCSSAYPVERYLRDAKIMEIIEGSNEMQQNMIAEFGLREIQS